MPLFIAHLCGQEMLAAHVRLLRETIYILIYSDLTRRTFEEENAAVFGWTGTGEGGVELAVKTMKKETRKLI